MTCQHDYIITFRTPDGQPVMWACSDCKLKFVPFSQMLTEVAEEREATISKIESEICHAEINNLRLAPLFGQRHGPLAVRVDSLAAVVDAIRARGEK